MSEFRIDPEFKSLIPPLSPDELSGLEASLVAEGNRVPIDVWQGIIVDGHSRYEICQRLRIPLRDPNELKLDDQLDVKMWIIRNQFGRRNINPYVRSVLVLKLKDVVGEKVKQNKGTRTDLGYGLRYKPPVMEQRDNVDFHEQSREGWTAPRLAKMAKVSDNTIIRVKVIEGKASPEVREKLVRGDPSVSISSVYKDIKREERKEKREEERKRLVTEQASKPAADDSGILVGDLSLLDIKLDDDSVDLFFTDPPYKEDDDCVALYGRLAELAQAKLKPGGLCLAYTPHAHLSTIIRVMTDKDRLSFCWVFAVEQMGAEARIWKYKFWVKWKPILVLTKTPPASRLTDTWVMDSVRGEGEDKRFHEWGQDVREAAYWIDALVPNGGQVVDPFCGGGTIPLATKMCSINGKKLRWVGVDKDETRVLVARARLEAFDGGSR